MNRTKCLFAALFPVLCSLAPAQDARTATLVGAVTDASGSAISGAVVVVTNAETAFVSRSQTNEEGSYYVQIDRFAYFRSDDSYFERLDYLCPKSG